MRSAVTGTEGKWMRSSGPNSGWRLGFELIEAVVLGLGLGRHDEEDRREVTLNTYWRNWLVV